jgi:cytochrome o ubiquinol oxidase subunit 2
VTRDAFDTDARAVRADARSARPAKSTLKSTLALARCLALCLAPLLLGACVGNIHMSFLNPQGPIAQREMAHFYWVVGIMGVFVAGPIFLGLPYILWRYRYGNPKPVGYTPKWRDNIGINVLTWAGPVLIVCALGYFVWRDAHKLDPYKPIASTQPALQVQVIGYDWKWLFIYPKQHIATIGTFVIPAGRPVTFHLTSATVMKSFFIPALGSQIYAMGGMVTQLNLQASKRGRFLGENTMYDGNGFHFEKFVAVAKSPSAFKAWVHGVQATGVPFNNGILKTISKRTSREQMAPQLPAAAVHGDSAYFTGVTARLFPRVVKATMDGKSYALKKRKPVTEPLAAPPLMAPTSATVNPGKKGNKEQP